MEQCTLDPANARADFSSGSTVTCVGHATLTRWALPLDAAPTNVEEQALADLGTVLEAHGITAVEGLRLVLATSTDRLPDVTISLAPNVEARDSILVVIDGVTALMEPPAAAITDEAGRHFTLTFSAMSIARDARGAWIMVLRSLPPASDAWAQREPLFRAALTTLGKVRAAGSPEPPLVAWAESGVSLGKGMESTPVPRRHTTRAKPPLHAPPQPPPAATTGGPPPAPPADIPAETTQGSEPPVPDEAPPVRRTRGRTRSDSGATRKEAAAKAALNVRRLPTVKFPEAVVAGETHPLVVKLSDKVPRTAIDRAIQVAIEAGEDSATIMTSLSAPGFTVLPDREQSITVGREFDARREQVTFTLTALAPAGGQPVSRDIRIDFWAGNTSIGGVTHWTTVTPAGWSAPLPPAKPARALPFATATDDRECELVLRVEGIEDADKPPFLLSLRCRIPGEPAYESRRVGRIDFTMSELSTLLHDLFASFAERFPVDGNATALRKWRSDLLDEIDTFGKWLWQKLPAEFRAEYFRLYDAKHLPASLFVHSTETLIPWELVVPYRDGKVLPRLGVAHVMGRWRPALGQRPQPQAFRVTRGTIANPRYVGTAQLVWSLLEANDVKQEVAAFTAMPTVDRASMKKLLDRTDTQFVHFTGHGEYAKRADLSTLILENGETIRAIDVVGSRLLAQGQPIVYLNACEVGSSGVTLGQMGGFAAQCVEGGCSGIVAPYWAVADDSAREFAVAFYAQLRAGRSIGEALQALRKEKPRDPTYQAFSYLGDPWTRPQFA